LVLLASNASPVATGKRLMSEAIPSIGPNSLDLLDLTDSVRIYRLFIAFMLQPAQNTRVLVVISNFGHLSQVIIPSMLTELESALGASVTDERKVTENMS
jgi:exocyst complex component 2